MIKKKFEVINAIKISLILSMCLACCDAKAISIAEASELFRPQSNLVTGQFNHDEHARITYVIEERSLQINDRAFFYKKDIACVKFAPNSRVEYIGQEAFALSSLQEITIPRSVKMIADYCFSNTQFLKNIFFEDNSTLTKIGAYAFSSGGIEQIIVPKSVAELGGSCFHLCVNLATVEFEEGSQLTSLGSLCFFGSGITAISIPQNVTQIGGHCFNRTFALKSVKFETAKLEKFADGLFFDSAIEEIEIPNSVRKICSLCFARSQLKSIQRTSSEPIIIVGNAFHGCEELVVENISPLLLKFLKI